MDRDEEAVDDSELCVKRYDDGRVYHVREIPDPQAELHQLHVEEIWQREGASGSHLLGRGGFGSVYKETCISDIRGVKLGRFRAVKVIEKGDQVTKAYYREELKALIKFSAPRYRPWFVEYFGWYEAMDRVFINMEHIEHGDLQRYLDRKFSERETNRIALQVAKGLGFMHQYNFIHRDLKPGNLLVVEKPPEKEWWVKISDFGISKRSTDGRLAYSTVIGTQEYMAPEVLLFIPKHRGDKASYTVATDMWSLGAICVRLITANPPFDPWGFREYFYHGARFDPEDALAGDGITQEGRDFIRAIMDRDPKLRLSAHEAIKHAWMAPSWRLSPGVPNSEPVVQFAKPSNPDSPGLADEYRATAQWDSGVLIEPSTGDPTIRPATTTQKTSSPTTVIQNAEETLDSITRQTGSNRALITIHAEKSKSIREIKITARLASGSEDGTVRIWDPATGQCVSTLYNSIVRSVAWSYDAARLASGSEDGIVRIWDLVTGQCVSTLEDYSSVVRSVAWSYDTTRLASGSYDKTVRIWDTATGQCISTLEGHSSAVLSVAWSYDAARLASGSSDETVKIWDPATGQCISTLKGCRGAILSVAWSHDAARLASGSKDRTVYLD